MAMDMAFEAPKKTMRSASPVQMAPTVMYRSSAAAGPSPNYAMNYISAPPPSPGSYNLSLASQSAFSSPASYGKTKTKTKTAVINNAIHILAHGNVKADPRLDKILFSQNVDGSWSVSDEICSLLKLDKSKLKSSIPKETTEIQWLTAIIIAFLEIVYISHKDEWELIADKTKTYLLTSKAPNDLIAQAKSFCQTNGITV